jgi:kynurenine formamidase
MSRLIDLSHTIEDGLITYRGFPAPIICDYLSRADSREHYDAGTEFQIGKIEMVSNTGTYVDSPFHRYPDGNDLSKLSLEHLADINGVVIRAPYSDGRMVDTGIFEDLNLHGKAVLICTGWSEHWKRDAYFENHPYLTSGAARLLRDEGAVLVGIDSLNIDDTDDGQRPVHSILLGANIPIVEHLTGLDLLPDHGFRFFAVPVKVKGLGSFPVRAFAKIAKNQ